MVTVLISSAGRRVELMECFRRAAAQLGVPSRLLASDAARDLSAACLKADQSVQVPRCDDPAFIPSLLHLCEIENVKLLVPTIDTELETLAENQDRFRRIGTEIAISHIDVIRLARNKMTTHAYLRSLDLPSPKTLLLESVQKAGHEVSFP